MGRKKLIIVLAIACFCFPLKLIQAETDETQGFIDRGEYHGHLGQYDQAIAEFNNAIKLSPNNADAFNDRGLAYILKGDIEQALADYNKAIELNSLHARAYNNRGLLYGRNKGQFTLAIADFTKAIEIDPGLTDAYISRGMAYSMTDQFDNAIADYTNVIEMNPQIPDAYFNRAASYYYKGDYVKAWDDVHKVQGLGGRLPPQFLIDLGQKMEEPKGILPQREKGLSVHFGSQEMVEGVSPGRFIISIEDKQKAFATAEELIKFFLNQNKVMQDNGIWLVVTNPDAYSKEEKEMLNKLEGLCKLNNIILFEARGMNLPEGWERIN